jgi:Uma2 family endonuclease
MTMAATVTRTEATAPTTRRADTGDGAILPMIVTAADRSRRLAQITWDDGRRFELIDGEEVVSASPSTAHQRAWRWLFRLLDRFVEARDLGEVFSAPYDVVLGDFQVFVPDICFVSGARADIIGPQGLNGPPDLVVEILSPSTRRDDLTRKLTEYARSGVREYWVCDVLYHRFHAYTLIDGKYEPLPEIDGRIRSGVLPGLVINVAALFASVGD